MSSGEFSPPYEPSQPATASTSMPIAHRISLAMPTPPESLERCYNTTLMCALCEVAIDHHLLRRVDERTVVLGNGCVCCSLRGDLADELRDLLGRRERGEVPPFRRVVVETTGVADPAPIVYTLLSEPVVKHHFELERVIATVDAVHGLRAPESVAQAAAADRLVVTKGDLASPGPLEKRLSALNPTARIVEASFGELEPDALFGGDRPPHAVPPPDGGHAEHGGVQ